MKKRYKVDVVIGGTYGDEGKGKCVNFLCQKNKYDYVFRVNASTNASHCVNLDNDTTEYVTKQLPSVFNQPGCGLVVSPATFLNIKEFKEELKKRPDLDVIKNNVHIASSVPLILDIYKEMSHQDSFRQNVGTTNQGTGIAMRERVTKNSIYLYDVYKLINYTELSESDDLSDLLEKFNRHFIKLDAIQYTPHILSIVKDIQKDLKEIYSMIGDFMVDYPNFISKEMPGKNILIEGCNGILLDNIFGVRPYTTSCSTTLNALMSYASLSPFYINETYTVVGAYFVCLNKRPFPTEIDDEKVRQHILEKNSEIDKAENMQRRVAWFDLPALKRALLGSESPQYGQSRLFMTKVDVLSGLDEIKVCTSYDIDGKTYDIMPDDTNMLYRAKPNYRTFKCWKTVDVDNKENGDLIIDFFNYINSELGQEYKIAYLSVGKKSNEIYYF